MGEEIFAKEDYISSGVSAALTYHHSSKSYIALLCYAAVLFDIQGCSKLEFWQTKL